MWTGLPSPARPRAGRVPPRAGRAGRGGPPAGGPGGPGSEAGRRQAGNNPVAGMPGQCPGVRVGDPRRRPRAGQRLDRNVIRTQDDNRERTHRGSRLLGGRWPVRPGLTDGQSPGRGPWCCGQRRPPPGMRSHPSVRTPTRAHGRVGPGWVTTGGGNRHPRRRRARLSHDPLLCVFTGMRPAVSADKEMTHYAAGQIQSGKSLPAGWGVSPHPGIEPPEGDPRCILMSTS